MRTPLRALTRGTWSVFVIDFDKLLQDPAHPNRLLLKWDSGDHLHPGDAGYWHMGEAFDLSLATSRSVRIPDGSSPSGMNAVLDRNLGDQRSVGDGRGRPVSCSGRGTGSTLARMARAVLRSIASTNGRSRFRLCVRLPCLVGRSQPLAARIKFTGSLPSRTGRSCPRGRFPVA